MQETPLGQQRIEGRELYIRFVVLFFVHLYWTYQLDCQSFLIARTKMEQANELLWL